MKNKLSFGSELELGDVDTRLVLPEGNTWDTKDYTIMNSSGLCNDPKKEFILFGSEINVKPSDSVDKHVQEIMNIYNVLGDRKSINHSTNFHVHVRVPGLAENLDLLKEFALWIFEHQEEVFKITENLIKPTSEDYSEENALKGAIKRYNRRKISHQKKLSLQILEKMIATETTQEFYEAHAPLSKKGIHQFQLATRCGINMMQLFNETDTLEFRHFSMSFNEKEIWSCIKWCEQVVLNILGPKKSPSELYKEYQYIFPKFIPYDYEKDCIFQLTNFGKLSRKEIGENIQFLLDEGFITNQDLK